MNSAVPDSKTLVAIYRKMALIKHSDDRVIGAMSEDKATLAEGEKAALAHGSADALVNTGFNLVTYGQASRGLPLI